MIVISQGLHIIVKQKENLENFELIQVLASEYARSIADILWILRERKVWKTMERDVVKTDTPAFPLEKLGEHKQAKQQ